MAGGSFGKASMVLQAFCPPFYPRKWDSLSRLPDLVARVEDWNLLHISLIRVEAKYLHSLEASQVLLLHMQLLSRLDSNAPSSMHASLISFLLWKKKNLLQARGNISEPLTHSIYTYYFLPGIRIHCVYPTGVLPVSTSHARSGSDSILYHLQCPVHSRCQVGGCQWITLSTSASAKKALLDWVHSDKRKRKYD